MRFGRNRIRFEDSGTTTLEVRVAGVRVASIGARVRTGEVPLHPLRPGLVLAPVDLGSVESVVEFGSAQSRCGVRDSTRSVRIDKASNRSRYLSRRLLKKYAVVDDPVNGAICERVGAVDL